MNIQYENKKLKTNYFLYEIVHHCNLNCKGCDHCAPIAEEEYVDIKTYKKDLEQMKKHFDFIGSIGIMGGEPLLHPKLNEIIKITRKILKHTEILIFTNAIELKNQPKIFWETMKKEKALIVITKYNLNINYSEIEQIAKQYRVIILYENERKIKNEFHKICYNEQGTEDIEQSHRNCFHRQFCTTLENGKLYKCPIIPASRHFNTFFNKNIEVTDEDSINIHTKLKKEEIYNYFNKPINFCRYCNMNGRTIAQEWGISKKEITEWT